MSKGKKVLAVVIGVLVLVVVNYIVMIVRLEVKYSSKADYNSDIQMCEKQDGDYHIIVDPLFTFENYALVEKEFYYDKYGCNATVSVIVKENIFGERSMLFSVHTEILTGSVSGEFDENLNFTSSGSKVIPLEDNELDRITDCQDEVYGIIRKADELWDLGVNIPEN